MSNYALLFKFIMVGNSAVGKSCLVMQFEKGSITSEHDTTIGVEFGSRIVTVEENRIKIQIWDTAGQENFRSLIRSYYRSAIGAVIVYDITRRQSFYDLQRWVEDIRENGNPSAVVMLCGNKIDLETEYLFKRLWNRRTVSKEEGVQFAEQNGLLFMETSAKTGYQVQEIFIELAKEVFNRIQVGRIQLGKHEPGVKLGGQNRYYNEPIEKQSLVDNSQYQKSDIRQQNNCC